MTSWMYELRITGYLNDDAMARIREELGPVFITTESARTLIVASVPDQSALMGLLHDVNGLGLSISELRRLSAPDLDSEPAASPAAWEALGADES